MARTGTTWNCACRKWALATHGSQGQHRTIVLALKTAELDLLAERTGRVPILLLDDVSSELDRSRNRRFFEVLSQAGGQVFLTTTHPEFILLEQDRIGLSGRGGPAHSMIFALLM